MIYCAGDCVNSKFRNYVLLLLTIMVVFVCIKDTMQSIHLFLFVHNTVYYFVQFIDLKDMLTV